MKKSDLQTIPGVGPNMEEHFIKLGYTSIASLKGQDAEALYLKDCYLHGGSLDRCVLYVYRLAIYFAENDVHEAEKLKWWNWKN